MDAATHLPRPVIVLTRVYSAAEAADLCGLTYGQIRHAMDLGRIAVERPGRGGDVAIGGLQLFIFFRLYAERMRAEPEPTERIFQGRKWPGLRRGPAAPTGETESEVPHE